MPKSSKAQLAYMKIWRRDNKDKIKEYSTQYRKDNKDKINEYSTQYRKDNKEAIAKHMKKYGKVYNKTPKGKMRGIICNWKQRGLVCEDYIALYNQYINVTNCDNCTVTFGKIGDGSGTHKCMDHCHTTGAFRNFLCCTCNNRRG